MQYYVIGPDGNKYGPADVPTLKQWVAENRINAQSMLEDFNTGQRVQAGSVPGLFETSTTATAAPNMGPAAGTMYSNPPTPGTVYNQGMSTDNGSNDLTLAWVFGAVGLFCCGIVFSSLGIWKAGVAIQKGNPGGNAARIFCIVTLILNLSWGILNAATVMNRLQNGGFPR